MPAADWDGTADAKVRVFVPLGEDKETRVIPDNLNPIFSQVIDIPYQFNTLEEAPPLVLSVFDSDKDEMFGGADDFMGRAFINLGEHLAKSQYVK